MTDELRAKFEAWVRVNVTDWHHLSADVKRFAEHVFAGGHASRDAEVEALQHKIQNLQRYELRETWETAWMSEDAAGEFVTYADVLKLLPVKVQENNIDKQE